jgi:hypothetical protein
MPVVFHNEGTTCFFNVAMQMLLGSPSFCTAIQMTDEDDDNGNAYMEWVHESLASESVKPSVLPTCPPGLIMSRRSGMVRIIKSLLDLSETGGENAVIVKVDVFSKFVSLLFNAIRTNEQHDAFETIDEIMDILSVPGTLRPQPRVVLPDVSETDGIALVLDGIRIHGGHFACLWGVTREVHACDMCNRVVRKEYSPFAWTTKVRDQYRVFAHCEFCTSNAPRTVTCEIVHAPSTIIVRVNRHNVDGSKSHNKVGLHGVVHITGRSYEMRVLTYHNGMSFQGGHYTCVLRRNATSSWIFNSDTACRFLPHDFDVRSHNTSQTYGAVYVQKHHYSTTT